MAEFLGSIDGDRGQKQVQGSKKNGISVAARSWNGSISIRMYVSDGVTYVRILAGPGSTSYPMEKVVYEGTMADLIRHDESAVA